MPLLCVVLPNEQYTQNTKVLPMTVDTWSETPFSGALWGMSKQARVPLKPEKESSCIPVTVVFMLSSLLSPSLSSHSRILILFI